MSINKRGDCIYSPLFPLITRSRASTMHILACLGAAVLAIAIPIAITSIGFTTFAALAGAAVVVGMVPNG